MPDVTDFLNQFSDPRAENKVTYPLSSLLFMSICSVCSGAETWGQIITWSETHKAWLNNYVDMSQGIPSYSTIRRLFTLIKPADFQLLLRGIVDSHHPVRKPEDHVAIDGKTLRGSHCHAKIVTAMQMVSAFSVENRLTLSEVKTNSKSNEITAIPVLLARSIEVKILMSKAIININFLLNIPFAFQVAVWLYVSRANTRSQQHDSFKGKGL